MNPKRGKIRDKPHDQGFEAGYNGASYFTNPHAQGTIAFEYWRRGWAEGVDAAVAKLDIDSDKTYLP